MGAPDTVIEVENLTMAYGSFVIQRDLTFTVKRGEVFIIMGGSGCGKSTLLRHLVGLNRPAEGIIKINGRDLWNDATSSETRGVLKQLGVLFQSGALWSSMTLAENIALPLEEYTELSESSIRELASLKLSLVGLNGFEDYYPSEISGGMRKRAALARAMALEPEVLFLDEPSAGLDPISARNLDELILQLGKALGTTFVVVTHDLPSIFKVGTNSIFLDPQLKTIRARGNPQELLATTTDSAVRSFLSRGEESADVLK
jgi:phospholipid/cholesterol/gamma-HCH transport system ATP-binding protein